MKRLVSLLFLAALAVGCATPSVPATQPQGQVTVRVQPVAGAVRKLMEVIPSSGDRLSHVLLYLTEIVSREEECLECTNPQPGAYRLAGEESPFSRTTLGPIAKANLSSPFVFSNLVAGQEYSIYAEGFDVNEVNLTEYTEGSYVYFTVAMDGTAEVSVPLKLLDVDFSATAGADRPTIVPGTSVIWNGKPEDIVFSPVPQ